MQSHTTKRFRQMFQALPDPIQEQAKDAYRLFLANPHDPSVRFKQIKSKPLYSARVGEQYRAVAVAQGDDLYWFWIGPHREYEKLIARY